MSTTTTKHWQDVQCVNGPYERWAQVVGKFIDLPALGLATSSAITFVAELSGTENKKKALAASGRAGNLGSTRLTVPFLWSDGGTFLPSFLPFIAQVRSGSRRVKFRELKGDNIREIQYSVSYALGVEPDADNPAAIDFGMNFPVHDATFERRRLKWATEKSPKAEQKTNGKYQTKSITILAIIDDGIAFAHPEHLDPETGKTRIAWCWSQSAAQVGPHVKSSKRKTSSVPFGREFSGTEIDGLRELHPFDHNAIYHQTGLTSQASLPHEPLSRMHAHGAHVLGSFSGNWQACAPSHAPVIAVDLPSSSSWDTSGYGKDMFIISAMHYIFRRADDIARAIEEQQGEPVQANLVINLSYGLTGGARDGRHLIEAAIDEMIKHRRQSHPTVLVMPSGNTFSDQLHARLEEEHFSPSGKSLTTAKLNWQIQPDDRTSSFLEIWLPDSINANQLTIDLHHETCGKINLSQLPDDVMPQGACGVFKQWQLRTSAGEEFGQMTFDHFRNGQIRVVIAVAPTVCRVGLSHPRTPAGSMTISINKTAKLASGESINCYIQRDESFGQGNTGANQSYFWDRGMRPFNDLGRLQELDVPGETVRRFGTINGMATASTTLVVGGLQNRGQFATEYCSAPRVEKQGRSASKAVGKPISASATTDRGQWLVGLRSSGTRPGISVSLRGTSSASPQIARVMAEQMANSRWSRKKWQEAAATNYVELLENALALRPAESGTASRRSTERLGNSMRISR